MAFKPNYTTPKTSREKKIEFASRIYIYDEPERVTKKKKQIKEDSEKRVKVHSRIIELKKLGFPKEEALKRIKKEFPDSQYTGFFENWVDNAYKEDSRTKAWRRTNLITR